MQRDRVTLRKHAPDDGRCFLSDMAIDEEERRLRSLAREYVQQIRRRRRIRSEPARTAGFPALDA